MVARGPGRVVFRSQAASGHVYPLLPLAYALRAAGWEALFVTGEPLVGWLDGLGFPATVAGRPIGWALDRVQADFPELTTSLPAGSAWRLDAALFGDVLPRANAPELIEVLSRLEPDLVVYEAADLATVVAAAELGLPAVCQGLWAVGRWHVPEAELAARQRALWAERHAGPLPLHPLCGTALLDPCPPSLRAAGTDAAVRRLPTRPVPWGDPAVAPPEPSRPPLAYLTLGTVGWGSVELLRTAMEGLAALPVHVVVALGHFDATALGAVPGSVRVERFVRQDLLLPTLDVAVHHGGSGTLLGAAAAGVPQLLLPLGADQFQNADALARTGAGLVLDRDTVTPTAVRSAAEALLRDPGYRAAAARLAAEVAAMPAPAGRVTDLAALART